MFKHTCFKRKRRILSPAMFKHAYSVLTSLNEVKPKGYTYRPAYWTTVRIGLEPEA